MDPIRTKKNGLESALISVGLLLAGVVCLRFLVVLCAWPQLLLLAAIPAGIGTAATHPRLRRWLDEDVTRSERCAGLRLPLDRACFLLHSGHGWAAVQSDQVVRLGVDDLVQETLGSVDEVVLPAVGATIRQGEPLVRLHHGHRCHELPAPAGGTVLEVNPALQEQPGLINSDPYGNGWCVKLLTPDLHADQKQLMAGEQARDWFEQEAHRLLHELSFASLAVCLGSESTDRSYRLELDDAGFERVRRSFLQERT